MKLTLTPETAIETFIKGKKENSSIPEEVYQTFKNYKKWNENALKGIINASAYYPEILTEENMEENIFKLLAEFKKREVERVF